MSEEKNRIELAPINQYLVEQEFLFLIDRIDLMNNRNQPEVKNDVKLDVESFKINNQQENDIYEVILTLNLLVKDQSRDIFKINMKYGGLFSVKNAQTLAHVDVLKILEVNCANILFPFLRAEVLNLNVRSGVSPINITPIDFLALFNSKNSH